MLIFEITKTNHPDRVSPLFWYSPPTTCVAYTTQAMISSEKQSKANFTLWYTLDAFGATKYYISHYNQWCCIHRMLRGPTWLIPDRELLPRLFMTCWHKFKIIFNSRPLSVQCRPVSSSDGKLLFLFQEIRSFSVCSPKWFVQIRSVTISSYCINMPAGGEKECLMCYVQVNEHILDKKTDLALLKCVPNLPIK